MKRIVMALALVACSNPPSPAPAATTAAPQASVAPVMQSELCEVSHNPAQKLCEATYPVLDNETCERNAIMSCAGLKKMGVQLHGAGAETESYLCGPAHAKVYSTIRCEPEGVMIVRTANPDNLVRMRYGETKQ